MVSRLALRPVLPLGALIAALAACSAPSGPRSDAGPGQISSLELCERLAALDCGVAARCFPAWARRPPEDCRTNAQAQCLARVAPLEAAMAAGTMRFDTVRLARCEVRAETSACPPSLPPDLAAVGVVPLADCALDTGLVVGNTPAGATCSDVLECRPGTVCVKPGGVCLGTCSSWPREGDACGFGCGPDLRCTSQGTCAPPLPVDAPCRASAECEPDLICLGTCRPRRALGEPCQWDPDRLSPCAPGLACDVAPWVQGAWGQCVTPRPSGARCHYHWSCGPGLVCADMDWSAFPSAAPGEGACREPDLEHANCPFTPYAHYVGDQCGAGLACSAISKTCEHLPAQGETCTPSTQDCAGFQLACRPSGSTDTGLCAGPVEVGGRCVFVLDGARTIEVPCATGACDVAGSGTCRPPSRSTGAPCTRDGECLSGRCAVQQDRTLRCAVACAP